MNRHNRTTILFLSLRLARKTPAYSRQLSWLPVLRREPSQRHVNQPSQHGDARKMQSKRKSGVDNGLFATLKIAGTLADIALHRDLGDIFWMRRDANA
ncbi:hypothetical protein [Accumulibacter sp.]|uniref:hypothetical protein n=1 Tax=Accumulibacter sp. TaxID=2053492 RepID=UPI0026128413|nr:hypothetical protein [Accumulibacter sp.]